MSIDPYCPYMEKGKSWGEFDLQAIAGRVAGTVPAEVVDAARKFVSACKASGITPDQAKDLLEDYLEPDLSGVPSQAGRR